MCCMEVQLFRLDGGKGGGRSGNGEKWLRLEYMREVGFVCFGDGLGVEFEESRGDVQIWVGGVGDF